MKRLIKFFFKILGYRIVKKSKKQEVFANGKGPKYSLVSPIIHNTKENMNEYFSNKVLFEKYVSGRQTLYHNFADQIVALNIHKKKRIRICDVGCGPGDLINILGEKIENAELMGFDHSEKLLEIAQSRFPQINFKEFNIFQDSKRYNEQFHLVICSEVLEHLIESRKAVFNLFELVEDGGILVITVPEGRNDNYLGHINFWSPESWTQFFKEIANESGIKNYETNLLKIEGKEYNMVALYK